jgi:hypothetical protein
MIRSGQRIGAVSVLGIVLLSTSGIAQRKPDFSGQWELTEALVTGTTRDGTTSDKPRRTTSTTISGAPFNCGRGCTISQKGQTLTVDQAQLGGDSGKNNSPPPAVTFSLNGRETKVIDSFNAPRELPVIARWVGNEVRVETVQQGQMATIAWTQTVSLEDGQLVVVSTATRDGEARGGTTFTYRRK